MPQQELQEQEQHLLSFNGPKSVTFVTMLHFI